MTDFPKPIPLDDEQPVDKDAVGKLLTDWGAEMKGRTDIVGEDGNLDPEKLNALPETKEIVAKLKDLGVLNRMHLMDLGFLAAGMILIFREEKNCTGSCGEKIPVDLIEGIHTESGRTVVHHPKGGTCHHIGAECARCAEIVQEGEEGECEFCGGEGEVSVDGVDTDGNVERGVDTQKCICKVDNGDDRSEDV